MTTSYIFYYAQIIWLCALLLLIISFFCAIRELVRRGWYKGLLNLSPALFLLILFSIPGPLDFFTSIGFRSAILLMGDYPAEYEQSGFYENGQKQEVRHYYHDTISIQIIRSDLFDYILFDSTDEIMKKPSERSQAWKDAMKLLPLGHMIARSALPTKRIFGSYYDIYYTSGDLEG